MNLVAAAALALGVALLVVVVTFGVARLRGRYDTIDTAWGAGFAVIAAVGFAADPTDAGSPLLATVLVIVWGIRLSVHLHLRNAGQGEDHRYRAMSARARSHPGARMFFRTYLTQAGVMWFVSLPVVFAQQRPAEIGVLGILGALVWCVGLTFEAVGDEQLRRFTADPANKGRVLDRGLWRYTRHPNYFGDACVWWGLYLIAAQQPPGAATVLSPVLMTWLLARGTGKPMTERRLRETRSGYPDYVSRTSGFLPLPPKKG
ncbi:MULTISPECIES: DUF1295 domain-containing protein [Prauserella salsuginis group]|uniref:Steroid 5-alpha reductase family enzyme n=2 Tax=Prauserella salsuginis group TaxID=2893672 RepID=A0A839XLU9_9PSEU|nr:MULTISPECIES: DUF1295 domain-containing protein [Prauserella salsuginis group]MBB3663721.1 steroid 5-alpha reductase family enzyme [Prauserella sediminis]MCR3722499.1 Steroid 5-alpha reductase family enzyme [Prauserella flava]MCR3736941.1 Steroid 5-alpha reductase family enzyme [Prauserella salsuginis]